MTPADKYNDQFSPKVSFWFALITFIIMIVGGIILYIL